ncbi:MAG: hypothetical protein WC916_03445 [Candidatus Woesearchaeota archaeon]
MNLEQIVSVGAAFTVGTIAGFVNDRYTFSKIEINATIKDVMSSAYACDDTSCDKYENCTETQLYYDTQAAKHDNKPTTQKNTNSRLSKFLNKQEFLLSAISGMSAHLATPKTDIGSSLLTLGADTVAAYGGVRLGRKISRYIRSKSQLSESEKEQFNSLINNYTYSLDNLDIAGDVFKKMITYVIDISQKHHNPEIVKSLRPAIKDAIHFTKEYIAIKSLFTPLKDLLPIPVPEGVYATPALAEKNFKDDYSKATVIMFHKDKQYEYEMNTPDVMLPLAAVDNLKKTDWDGSVYSAVKSFYNCKDPLIVIRGDDNHEFMENMVFASMHYRESYSKSVARQAKKN